MHFRRLLIALAWLILGCAGTTLDVRPEHPASPSARTPPAADPGRVLDPEFVPPPPPQTPAERDPGHHHHGAAAPIGEAK